MCGYNLNWDCGFKGGPFGEDGLVEIIIRVRLCEEGVEITEVVERVGMREELETTNLPGLSE